MMMGFGMGCGFLGILLLGIVVYLIFKYTNGRKHHGYYDKSDALEILKERYAKGEITEEEYERKKNMLID
ncbi:putative membrane protein [Caloranaerobacter azorensis DSM 13643]|uniref:Putative membrane protein n=1 Tax=Caloranaerobacter azorensis DSM 13643 TaxID=1121264 RepID=A0A1M5VCB7_9FIRM|nr:putative membrane protein [Caloranaerobacter azorensis DSM 13643]